MSEVETLRLQNDEFKALQNIYLEQFHAIREAHPQKFSIECQPYAGKEDQYKLKILFEFTPNYPHSALKYELEPITGLTRDNITQIISTIEDIIHTTKDRPVVYDIVEEVRIWLQEYLVEGKAFEKDEEMYKKKQEVFEKPKFSTFTPVTIESFTAWKKQFDARNKLKKIEKKETEIKITGKEWFLGKKGDEIDEDDDEDDEDEDDEEEEDEEEVKKIIERDDVEMNELFNTE